MAVSPEEMDWKRAASAAAREMERHARAIIDSCNLIRDELDLPPLRVTTKPTLHASGRSS